MAIPRDDLDIGVTDGDATDLFPVADRAVDRVGEGMGDSVHPTNRLEHQHRLVPRQLEREIEPQLASEQIRHRRRRFHRTGFQTGAGRDGVAAVGTSLVAHPGAERTESPEELDHPLGVLGPEVGVERALTGGLRQQLADVSEVVGLGRSVADPAVRQWTEGAGSDSLKYQPSAFWLAKTSMGDAELTAVLEGGVALRDAGWTGFMYWPSPNVAVWVTPSMSVADVRADREVPTAGSVASLEDLAGDAPPY